MKALQDSIQSVDGMHTLSLGVDSAARTFKPRHPYQVLRMLPADATPEQQDSAIQANFQPGEIHFSQRPDTLHIPGHPVKERTKWKDVPLYYKETFFSNDTMFQAEYIGLRNGMPGIAMPYTMRADPYITLVLLGCIFLSTIMISRTRGFIGQKMKMLFRTSSYTMEKETSSETSVLLVLNLMSAMLTSFFMFLCAEHFISDTYLLPTQYHLIGIFFALILTYKLFKALCYCIVNPVFWDGKQNLQYLKTKTFVEGMESTLLLLMVMIQIYLESPLLYTIFAFIFIQVVVKLLTFYKCYVIFFNQKGGYIQFFLYLCALEITPLAVLWTAAFMIANVLKVIF